MAKKSKKMKSCQGYMTVYLSLTLAVLLSLCLSMIEGVRSNAIILESEIASDIAVNSLLAEYNRELMKQYNIFAIEDSYGGNNASLDNTDAHLVSYLNNNFSANHFLGAFLNYRDFLGMEVESAQTEGVLYLTDDNGAVFMRRAYEAVKDDVGMTLLSEIRDWATSIESSGLETMDMQGNMALLEEQVEQAQIEASQQSEDDNESDSDEDTMGEIIEVDSNDSTISPAASILSSLRSGITNLVVDDLSTISRKEMDTSALISNRMNSGNINAGNLALEDQSSIDDIAERMVFQEYLLRYMGQYNEEREDDALSYQIEYIIAGRNNDRDNLDVILSRIFAIRFSADYIYIQSDEEKKEIAEILGEAIGILTYTEELSDVYKELYLLAWAETEALYDVKCILAGNRINLFKDEDHWHTSFLLVSDDREYSGDGEGLSYTDYLRIFMTLMSKDRLVARAMDIVESDVRLTPGNAGFRMDACIDTIQVFINIQSTFGYSYSFRLKRKYE